MMINLKQENLLQAFGQKSENLSHVVSKNLFCLRGGWKKRLMQVFEKRPFFRPTTYLNLERILEIVFGIIFRLW